VTAASRGVPIPSATCENGVGEGTKHDVGTWDIMSAIDLKCFFGRVLMKDHRII
jgi:hypothetical protein